VAPVLAWLSLRDIRRLFVPILALGGVVAGYMAASYFEFGSLVPSSTSALRFLWYPVWLEREVTLGIVRLFSRFPQPSSGYAAIRLLGYQNGAWRCGLYF